MEQDALFSPPASIEELLASGVSVEALLAAGVLTDEDETETDAMQQREMEDCQVRQIAFTPTHVISF